MYKCYLVNRHQQITQRRVTPASPGLLLCQDAGNSWLMGDSFLFSQLIPHQLLNEFYDIYYIAEK